MLTLMIDSGLNTEDLICFIPAVCESTSSRKDMAPVSSPVKQSYADRPSSQESIPAEGIIKCYIHIYVLHELLSSILKEDIA